MRRRSLGSEQLTVDVGKVAQVAWDLVSLVVRLVEHGEKLVEDGRCVVVRWVRERCDRICKRTARKNPSVLGEEAEQDAREEDVETTNVVLGFDRVRLDDLVVETSHPLGSLDVGVVQVL